MSTTFPLYYVALMPRFSEVFLVTTGAKLSQAQERKQAAILVLANYSQFVMACFGEGVTPNQLRLHLMKEISGMPTSLDAHKAPVVRKGQAASSSSKATSSVNKG